MNYEDLDRLTAKRAEAEAERNKIVRDQKSVMAVGNTVLAIGVVAFILSMIFLGAVGIVVSGVIILGPAIVLRQILKHGGDMQISDSDDKINEISREMGQIW